MPYPCSHFYFDIKFGDRLYSKEKRRTWPLLFWIKSVAKIDIKVKVTTWIGHEGQNFANCWGPEIVRNILSQKIFCTEFTTLYIYIYRRSSWSATSLDTLIYTPPYSILCRTFGPMIICLKRFFYSHGKKGMIVLIWFLL